jgi:hypothetical protein
VSDRYGERVHPDDAQDQHQRAQQPRQPRRLVPSVRLDHTHIIDGTSNTPRGYILAKGRAEGPVS